MAGTQTDKNGTYQMRPDLKSKFRPSLVKDVIYSVLEEKLQGFVYEAEAADEMAIRIAEILRDKMRVEGRVNGQGMWVFLGHSTVQKDFKWIYGSHSGLNSGL
ncbi:Tctex1 domain-containing protein 2 [Chionoecetes opilio]|uniref:Tctex1 domain-containing protein 2 n=1 Tax=Chionoecetes opilio TaxID=41210 RepID=A0A8J5D5A6_CHIOP|nr:Tctex1 domain-containing protein 2 [Chionoecetes opilio]